MSRKFYLRTQGSPVDGWWRHWIDKSNLQSIFWYLWNFWKQIRKKISNHDVVWTSPISPAETPKKIINRNRVHFWYWNSMLCTLLPKVSRVCATQSIFRFCEEELVDLSHPCKKIPKAGQIALSSNFGSSVLYSFWLKFQIAQTWFSFFLELHHRHVIPKVQTFPPAKKSTQRYSIQHLVPSSVPDKNY